MIWATNPEPGSPVVSTEAKLDFNYIYNLWFMVLSHSVLKPRAMSIFLLLVEQIVTVTVPREFLHCSIVGSSGPLAEDAVAWQPYGLAPVT